MFAGMVLLFMDTYFNVSGTWHTVLIFGGFITFNLFMNMGPNATTFSLAPELFPTQLRSTASGFASGFAKIGATLGVFIFPIIKNKFGVDTVLISVSFISLLALFITTIYSEKIQGSKSLEAHHR
jgi:nitrate/nitrite transporter NarK